MYGDHYFSNPHTAIDPLTLRVLSENNIREVLAQVQFPNASPHATRQAVINELSGLVHQIADNMPTRGLGAANEQTLSSRVQLINSRAVYNAKKRLQAEAARHARMFDSLAGKVNVHTGSVFRNPAPLPFLNAGKSAMHNHGNHSMNLARQQYVWAYRT